VTTICDFVVTSFVVNKLHHAITKASSSKVISNVSIIAKFFWCNCNHFSFIFLILIHPFYEQFAPIVDITRIHTCFQYFALPTNDIFGGNSNIKWLNPNVQDDH
jgi:hypothetical protein